MADGRRYPRAPGETALARAAHALAAAAWRLPWPFARKMPLAWRAGFLAQRSRRRQWTAWTWNPCLRARPHRRNYHPKASAGGLRRAAFNAPPIRATRQIGVEVEPVVVP